MIRNFFKNSNKIAFIDEKFGKVSYSKLKKETENISKLIKSNSVALLISDNKYEFVKGYLSFLKKNKIICLVLDISLSNEFYKKIFVTYKPNYIFVQNRKIIYLMIVKKNCDLTIIF